jgi:hypothetical protein
MKTYQVTFHNHSLVKQYFHLVRFNRSEGKAVILDTVTLAPNQENTVSIEDATDIGVTTGGSWSPGDIIKQDYLPNCRLVDFRMSDNINVIYTEKNTWEIRL